MGKRARWDTLWGIREREEENYSANPQNTLGTAIPQTFLLYTMWGGIVAGVLCRGSTFAKMTWKEMILLTSSLWDTEWNWKVKESGGSIDLQLGMFQ